MGERAPGNRTKPAGAAMVALAALLCLMLVGASCMKTSTSTEGSAQPPAPASSVSASAVSNAVIAGCIGVANLGTSSLIVPMFTVVDPEAGVYRLMVGQTPTGPLVTFGSASNGHNPVVAPFEVTRFGSFSGFTFVAPNGATIPPGSYGSGFSFTLNASNDVTKLCTPDMVQAPAGAPNVAISPLTRDDAGRTYLMDVAPVNQTEPAFRRMAQAWNASTTNAQAQAQAMPLRLAFESVLSSLVMLALQYMPAAAHVDADASAVSALLVDLGGLSKLQDMGVDQWLGDFDGDVAKLIAESALARMDLGLPPQKR